MLNILSAKSLTHLGTRGLEWKKVRIKYKYLSESQNAFRRLLWWARKQCFLKYTLWLPITNQKIICLFTRHQQNLLWGEKYKPYILKTNALDHSHATMTASLGSQNQVFITLNIYSGDFLICKEHQETTSLHLRMLSASSFHSSFGQLPNWLWAVSIN